MNDSTRQFGYGVALTTGFVASLIFWKFYSGSRSTSSPPTSSPPKDDHVDAPRVQGANASDVPHDQEHAGLVCAAGGADEARVAQREEGVQGGQNGAPREAVREPPLTVKGQCIGCVYAGKFRCSRCRKALFCSQECQRKMWKSHKLTCNVRATKTWISTGAIPPKEAILSQAATDTEAGRVLHFEQRMAEGGTLVQNGQFVDAKRTFQKLYDENDPTSLERGKAARLLAAAMACLFEDSEIVQPLLTEAMRLAHKYNDFVLTFDTLTVMAGEEKRKHGPDKATHLYEQALELCERQLGNLSWKHQAQALANKACCLAVMGPQERLAAHELMNRASTLYEKHTDDLDSASCHSWIQLNCNNASLIAQTHPELAVNKYQETLKLFKLFPNPRLEDTCRINLNNLDVPQPELDHRLFNTECPICMEPLEGSKFILKCRHAFHHQCILGDAMQLCPLCRS
eukprot:GEMP01054394.1.p1 GENE.GEMP01054394.1~~GEMP01054394.1.p1  ORF type:complete len:473 (+),score=100.35 GEMP01054394.1:49-1419(+)